MESSKKIMAFLVPAMLAIAYNIFANLITDPLRDHWTLAADVLGWGALPYVSFAVLLIVWAAVGLYTHKTSEATVLPSNLGTGIQAQPLFSASRKERDYVKAIKESDQRVRVVWNTGGGLKRAHELEELLPHLAVVVLPHPDTKHNPSLIGLTLAQETTVGDERRRAWVLEEIPRAIREVTDVIAEYNDRNESLPAIRVWWRKGHMGNLLTIADDWAFIELFLPGLAPAYRPAVYIKKVTHPDLYRRLEESFSYILTDVEDGLAARRGELANEESGEV